MSGLIRSHIMKKIELKYFNGTGNSLQVLNRMKNEFKKNDYDVDIASITDNKDFDCDCELAGFCFPVYAYGLPRICRTYLNSLPVQKTSKKAFLVVSAGSQDEIGYALENGKEILRKKNFKVVYSEAVQMPSNWIPFMLTPPKNQAQAFLEKGAEKAVIIASNIMNGISLHHAFNIPKSIEIKEGKPRWKSSCEQCMRCVNSCKQEAIYQTFGGQTEGKERYLEPHFKPLRNCSKTKN